MRSRKWETRERGWNWEERDRERLGQEENKKLDDRDMHIAASSENDEYFWRNSALFMPVVLTLAPRWIVRLDKESFSLSLQRVSRGWYRALRNVTANEDYRRRHVSAERSIEAPKETRQNPRAILPRWHCDWEAIISGSFCRNLAVKQCSHSLWEVKKKEIRIERKLCTVSIQNLERCRLEKIILCLCKVTPTSSHVQNANATEGTRSGVYRGISNTARQIRLSKIRKELDIEPAAVVDNSSYGYCDRDRRYVGLAVGDNIWRNP